MKTAPNPEAGAKLLAFLSSAEGQELFVAPSQEFAINPEATQTNAIFPAPFKADNLAVDKLAEYNRAAVRVFDRVGWR